MKGFLSRKFLLAVASVLVLVLTAAYHHISWEQAVWSILSVVLAYLGVEGALDFRAVGKPKQP